MEKLFVQVNKKVVWKRCFYKYHCLPSDFLDPIYSSQTCIFFCENNTNLKNIFTEQKINVSVVIVCPLRENMY